MKLEVKPPFAPMEALSVDEVPTGEGWQYEPKWDGFRCLAFRDGSKVELQSKSGQSLTRYFPEIVDGLRALKPPRFVLDGELVIPLNRLLSFDDLLQRIHPAESRVRKLAAQTPTLLIVFDLLADEKGKSLLKLPLRERRILLEKLIEPPGFTGRAPGGPSRWSTRRSAEWKPLKPELVVEVTYDHVSGERFRHGTGFVRWRPDKLPKQCTMDQLKQKRSRSLELLLQPRAG